jgi:hypothetical protein
MAATRAFNVIVPRTYNRLLRIPSNRFSGGPGAARRRAYPTERYLRIDVVLAAAEQGVLRPESPAFAGLSAISASA